MSVLPILTVLHRVHQKDLQCIACRFHAVAVLGAVVAELIALVGMENSATRLNLVSPGSALLNWHRKTTKASLNHSPMHRGNSLKNKNRDSWL